MLAFLVPLALTTLVRTPVVECRSTAPDSVLASDIVGAVNAGGDSTLRGLVARRWTPEPVGARATAIVVRLGGWHWRSRRLDIESVCVLDPMRLAVRTRNSLTAEIDSLVLVRDPSGERVRMLEIVEGASVVFSAADTSSDAGRVASLRALTHRLADAGVFAGEVLFAKGGVVLYHEAVGTLNPLTGTRARIGDRYNIASVGKLFTGAAIMQLVADGRIRLDDTLGQFLADSLRPRAAGAVPIRTLLSHTSGVRRDVDSLAFRPGTRFEYGNYGYYLLGRLVESVTGVPFAEHYQRALFARAGMSHTLRYTGAPGQQPPPPGFDLGFDSTGPVFRENPQLVTTPATGAGGFYSTAEDLFRFSEALRLGRIVPLALVDSMRTPKADLGAVDYGYGIDRYRGRNVWGSSGFIPGANADVELYGDSGYTLVVVSNRAANEPIRRRMTAMLGGQPFRSAGIASVR